MLTAFVPAAETLTEAQMHAVLERADGLLAARPQVVVRQIRLALFVLRVLCVLRHGRGPARLSTERRRKFLAILQDAPLLRLRLAVWGLRSVLFFGYYADPERQWELGYRPSPQGWAAVRENRSV